MGERREATPSTLAPTRLGEEGEIPGVEDPQADETVARPRGEVAETRGVGLRVAKARHHILMPAYRLAAPT